MRRLRDATANLHSFGVIARRDQRSARPALADARKYLARGNKTALTLLSIYRVCAVGCPENRGQLAPAPPRWGVNSWIRAYFALARRGAQRQTPRSAGCRELSSFSRKPFSHMSDCFR